MAKLRRRRATRRSADARDYSRRRPAHNAELKMRRATPERPVWLYMGLRKPKRRVTAPGVCPPPIGLNLLGGHGRAECRRRQFDLADLASADRDRLRRGVGLAVADDLGRQGVVIALAGGQN